MWGRHALILTERLAVSGSGSGSESGVGVGIGIGIGIGIGVGVGVGVGVWLDEEHVLGAAVEPGCSWTCGLMELGLGGL